MLVKIDLSKIKRVEWSQYAIRFAAGGAITVVAGILAQKFGPAVGGLFLAFPAIFPASVTLVEKTETSRKHDKGMHGERRARAAAALETYGAVLGSLALAAFAAFVCALLTRYPAAIILPAATLLWTFCAVSEWAFLRWWRHTRNRARSHTRAAAINQAKT
jgi:hypothetical protein